MVPSMETLGKYKTGKLWSPLGTMHGVPEKCLHKPVERELRQNEEAPVGALVLEPSTQVSKDLVGLCCDSQQWALRLNQYGLIEGAQ